MPHRPLSNVHVLSGYVKSTGHSGPVDSLPVHLLSRRSRDVSGIDASTDKGAGKKQNIRPPSPATPSTARWRRRGPSLQPARLYISARAYRPIRRPTHRCHNISHRTGSATASSGSSFTGASTRCLRGPCRAGACRVVLAAHEQPERPQLFNQELAPGRPSTVDNRCCGLPDYDFTTPEYASSFAPQTTKFEASRGIDPFPYGYNSADTRRPVRDRRRAHRPARRHREQARQLPSRPHPARL
jgi:hypothetical protein